SVNLYVHVPFCARRCSYCDFSIAVRRDVPSRRYADAVLQEWRGAQGDPGWRESPALDTVYFGGGTPSRLDPASLAAILEGLRAERPIAPDAEITLEANPDDVTPEAADRWRAAGIARASLGVQSFAPGVLAWMHRTHSAAQARGAVAVLRAAGFEDLSIDLIYGLPPELRRDWEADLEEAFALEPDHLSCYGLTVEAHTPLGHWTARGQSGAVDEVQYADEFLQFSAALAARGWDHYEVSNAARPGRRARHNSGYWTGAPYIGLGPSAHSATAGERRWNIREYAAWDLALREDRPTVEGRERLAAAQLRIEALYLGLRTAAGVAAGLLEEAVRERWIAAGWARLEEGRLRLSPEGWLRLDALVADAA
ncbi:MAG TPA: radical SAM family heme chaperone HemW, partial [Gemmatimonadales bacterium]|nr:radical SAM family heme chaperone HemW [Gemmatimonadales bacterium]